MSEWLEVGPDNYVLVTEGSLLNSCLIVGSERALVEQGAHLSFEDSFPAEWADSNRQISALRHRYEFLIPGTASRAATSS